MTEVVKTVNGYEITRLVGTHGAYHVNIWADGEWLEFHTFHSIKAAAQFCESLPKREMRQYKITFYLMPDAEDVVIVVPAKSYEEACVFAKGYRRESFSCVQI